MVTEQWGRDFFQMADRLNPDEYSRHFAADGQMVFGSEPPLRGPEGIRRGIGDFYAGLQAMRHEIIGLWVPAPGIVVNQAVAHYTQRGGREVAVPVVTVLHVAPDTGLVRTAQLYLDLAPLRNAADQAA